MEEVLGERIAAEDARIQPEYRRHTPESRMRPHRRAQREIETMAHFDRGAKPRQVRRWHLGTIGRQNSRDRIEQRRKFVFLQGATW